MRNVGARSGLAIGLTLLGVFASACLGNSHHRHTAAGDALDVVRASHLVQQLRKGSSVRFSVFSTSPGSVAIAVEFSPPVAVDATLPSYDRGRSSTYHLSARGVQILGLTVLDKGARIVGAAPEWTSTFKLDDAHWIGPDLGYAPAGGE